VSNFGMRPYSAFRRQIVRLLTISHSAFFQIPASTIRIRYDLSTSDSTSLSATSPLLPHRASAKSKPFDMTSEAEKSQYLPWLILRRI
jgi:hypothetical protein